MKRDEDSVGSSVYQGLVQLTFLCGRGLPTHELLTRFLVAMRPQIPATGLWLFENARLVARDVDDGIADPPPPQLGTAAADIALLRSEDGSVVAPVLPGLVLVVAIGDPARERSNDVVLLMARILGLVWFSETRADPSTDLDDYQAAKHLFKKRWLRALLRRHGSVTLAARAAGLSRGSVYQLMDQLGVEHPRQLRTAGTHEGTGD